MSDSEEEVDNVFEVRRASPRDSDEARSQTILVPTYPPAPLLGDSWEEQAIDIANEIVSVEDDEQYLRPFLVLASESVDSQVRPLLQIQLILI